MRQGKISSKFVVACKKIVRIVDCFQTESGEKLGESWEFVFVTV